MQVNKALSNLLLRVIRHTLKKAAMSLDLVEYYLAKWIRVEPWAATYG